MKMGQTLFWYHHIEHGLFSIQSLLIFSSPSSMEKADLTWGWMHCDQTMLGSRIFLPTCIWVRRWGLQGNPGVNPGYSKIWGEASFAVPRLISGVHTCAQENTAPGHSYILPPTWEVWQALHLAVLLPSWSCFEECRSVVLHFLVTSPLLETASREKYIPLWLYQTVFNPSHASVFSYSIVYCSSILHIPFFSSLFLHIPEHWSVCCIPCNLWLNPSG